jgi:hypothetical protein
MSIKKVGDAAYNQTAYASNVASISAGATYGTPSAAVALPPWDEVNLVLYLTGDVSSAGAAVTFYVALSPDGTSYDSVGTPLAVNIPSGGGVVRSAPIPLNIRNNKKLKVLSIVNGDASYAITAVNVQVVGLAQTYRA